MKFIVGFILGLAVVSWGKAQPVLSSDASELVQSIDRLVLAEMRRMQIPGAALSVVKDGEPLTVRAYGFSDLEHRVSTIVDTSFCLASITKQFVATGMMLLVQEGKLSLDDKVSEYLEDLPPSWNGITFRHLLTHTSGIIDVENDLPSVAHTVAMLALDYTDEELLDLARKRPLNFSPGEKYSYSNTGYHMCGMVIEKLTGKNWGDFLQERIFAPLGMNQTRINRLSEIVPHRASGYWCEDGKLTNGPHASPTMMAYAAGGLRSTVTDLVKWDAGLNSHAILSRKQMNEMLTPVKLSNGKTYPYGLGWSLRKTNGHESYGHSGGRESGYQTYMVNIPDLQLTVILLTNQFGASYPRTIVEKVIDLVEAWGK